MKKILVMGLVSILAYSSTAIYIWSKSFHTFSNDAILSTLKNNHIDEAIISVDSNLKKLQAFIELAQANNIETSLLIGYNKIIYPKNYWIIDRIFTTINKLNIETIVLDVEPQALADLKKWREYYLKLYTNMLHYMKERYPQYKIDISIPPFYTLEWINKNQNLFHRIYLMAYQNKNFGHLQRKITPFHSFYPKLSLVFNCKEFSSYKTIQEWIMKLDKLNIHSFALHNLRTCQRLFDETK